jgi:ATP-dependent DNA ligase
MNHAAILLGIVKLRTGPRLVLGTRLGFGAPILSSISHTAFIEPCLPSPADRPPSGSNWIHEIKHYGYRLMARRDAVGIRLVIQAGQ